MWQCDRSQESENNNKGRRMGRSKCVRSPTPKKVMSFSEFNNRLRKTFYYGNKKLCDEEMEVSRPLAEYASDIFSEPHKGHSLSRLNSIAAGSVHTTHATCSLIMALIYLDRLNATDSCYARRITPQELFIVSMMISKKFYSEYDEDIYLKDWAEGGNMTEERLKQLELEFLCAIEWNVYVSNEQFFEKLQAVEKSIARREGLKRGWLTYTELVQMLPSFTLAKFLLNNFALLAMSYAASVITLAGAFFLASQIPVPTKPLQNNELNMVVDNAETLSTNATCIVNKTIVDKSYPEIANDMIASNKQTLMLFNIEAELLKFETQYAEDNERELLDDLRRSKHNEIHTYSRLSLPGALHSCYNISLQMENIKSIMKIMKQIGLLYKRNIVITTTTLSITLNICLMILTIFLICINLPIHYPLGRIAPLHYYGIF